MLGSPPLSRGFLTTRQKSLDVTAWYLARPVLKGTIVHTRRGQASRLYWRLDAPPAPLQFLPVYIQFVVQFSVHVLVQ